MLTVETIIADEKYKISMRTHKPHKVGLHCAH